MSYHSNVNSLFENPDALYSKFLSLPNRFCSNNSRGSVLQGQTTGGGIELPSSAIAATMVNVDSQSLVCNASTSFPAHSFGGDTHERCASSLLRKRHLIHVKHKFRLHVLQAFTEFVVKKLSIELERLPLVDAPKYMFLWVPTPHNSLQT